MNKAYGYIRVSTSHQAELGYSLDNQQQAIKDYCKVRNIHLLKIYVDEGRSGRTTNRPEFQEMLQNIKKGLADCVVIYKIDRFARNVTDFSRLRKEFQKEGVGFFSVMEGDLSNGSSLVSNMLASVAEWESEVNSQRTKDALMEKFRSGWQPTPPCVGYRSTGGEEERKFCEPDSYAGPIVKRMFELYSTGSYSIEKLREWLQDKNILSKNGNIISFSKIHNILTNPFYYGLIRWHGQSKTGKHIPLITKELFEACNYILAKNRNFLVRERRYNFLLRGFTYCSCGMRLTADWHDIHSNHKKIAYYHCQKRYSKDCRQPYIEVSYLESQVEEKIKNIEFNEEYISMVQNKTMEFLASKKKNGEGMKQAVVNQKMALEQKRNRLEDLVLSEYMDRDTYRRKHAELQEKIGNLQTQMYEAEQDDDIDIPLMEKTLLWTRNIHQTYQQANDVLKRYYLRFLFESFTVKDKKIVETVPTQIFDSLNRANLVRFKDTQLLGVDSNHEPRSYINP
ncbi:recombinase family protein [Candidatus Roizmanbacteria bacterium]|nr:recombinase family protein [Candidatus Roizmanbacteria bacterium]